MYDTTYTFIKYKNSVFGPVDIKSTQNECQVILSSIENNKILDRFILNKEYNILNNIVDDMQKPFKQEAWLVLSAFTVLYLFVSISLPLLVQA